MIRRAFLTFALITAVWLAAPARAAAQTDQLFDSGYEESRSRLLELINGETVAIDVAFWFMEDPRYTAALIRKWNEGVKVRVLCDPRGSGTNPLNTDRLRELKDAGIPMRYKIPGDETRVGGGILHWKVMLFHGQGWVEFSAGNYSEWAFVPATPYVNYEDEMIYFTNQTSIVNTFRTRYDDLWTDTVRYGNYANITTSPVRSYPIYPKDPDLNYPPYENYRSRIVPLYDAETLGIDVMMYRNTDPAHADAMIRANGRGVPVRLITEPQQYRDPKRYMHSYNIDRMHAAGVPIRHCVHENVNHQKSVILKGQTTVVWGSSNWTHQSADAQDEHNYFTKKPYFLQKFTDQFERKWNNMTGITETEPFRPLPPDSPSYLAPVNGATDLDTTSVTLKWNGGLWAHVYDVYFGTTPDPPLYAQELVLGPSDPNGASGSYYAAQKSYIVTRLMPGVRYYWRVVGRTMANLSASGPVYSFTTGGTGAPPPPAGTLGPGDILLHASRASVVRGAWRVLVDGNAAGGAKIGTSNAGAAKIAPALASPTDYIELTFTAEAGKPYRIWARGYGENNYWGNDSMHVQFSDSVTSSGTPTYRIGTTSSAEVTIEDGPNAGLSGWGWQDNGYGTMGPLVYFATSGSKTMRVQKREDGLWIDQIMLSPEKFLNTSPGLAKNDTTLYPHYDGTGEVPEPPPPPPPPPPASDPSEVVLYASTARIVGTEWQVVADSTAAGGARIHDADAGAAKLNTALASPSSYFELTFYAEANVPYHLWIRGKAQNNYWGNDSVHVQFSDSTTETGSPIYRIGTTSAAWVNLEDASGAGLSGWGWQDNGYGGVGPLIYFATTGNHTIRVQTREDGFSIDQIVLSYSAYLYNSPGALKNDVTILPPSTGEPASTEPAPEPEPEPSPDAPEIVLYASRASTAGAWTPVSDATAAGGAAVAQPDAGAAKIATALAAPADYLELTFSAQDGIPYRLWLRGKAEDDHWANDSVHVQFSGSVDAGGAPVYRIGTTGSTVVVLEDCTGCGVKGWGWQDNGYGAGVLGPPIYFAADGPQTVRIQTREDGLTIDQIVLSPKTYLDSAPGALKDDTTILPESGG